MKSNAWLIVRCPTVMIFYAKKAYLKSFRNEQDTIRISFIHTNIQTDVCTTYIHCDR